jgi:hypothetical protein
METGTVCFIWHSNWICKHEKMEVGLFNLHAICDPHINFWLPEPIFMKLGMYIMSPETIFMAYIINPSLQCLWVYMYIPYHC